MAENRQSTQVAIPHESHGNSVAAWVTVSIMLVGFLILVFAWVKQDIPLYLVAAVVIAVGAVVGKVLAVMGFGIKHD